MSSESSPLEPLATCRAATLWQLYAERQDAAAQMAATGEPYRLFFTKEEREPQDCGACGGKAAISLTSAVTTDKCLGSGSCEISFAEMHPEQYQDADGQPVVSVVSCAGLACRALVEGAGTNCPTLVGECTVDTSGSDWRANAIARLNAMRPPDSYLAMMEDPESTAWETLPDAASPSKRDPSLYDSPTPPSML